MWRQVSEELTAINTAVAMPKHSISIISCINSSIDTDLQLCILTVVERNRSGDFLHGVMMMHMV